MEKLLEKVDSAADEARDMAKEAKQGLAEIRNQNFKAGGFGAGAGGALAIVVVELLHYFKLIGH